MSGRIIVFRPRRLMCFDGVTYACFVVFAFDEQMLFWRSAQGGAWVKPTRVDICVSRAIGNTIVLPALMSVMLGVMLLC